MGPPGETGVMGFAGTSGAVGPPGPSVSFSVVRTRINSELSFDYVPFYF